MQPTTTTPGPGAAAALEDVPAEERVHHHARLDADGRVAGGPVRTLCGLTVRPRPDARELPCCPMCAERMGGPCRSA